MTREYFELLDLASAALDRLPSERLQSFVQHRWDAGSVNEWLCTCPRTGETVDPEHGPHPRHPLRATVVRLVRLAEDEAEIHRRLKDRAARLLSERGEGDESFLLGCPPRPTEERETQ